MPERPVLRNTLCSSCYSPRSTDSYSRLLALIDCAGDLKLRSGLISVRTSNTLSCPWFYPFTAAQSLHNLGRDDARFLLIPFQSTVYRCSFQNRYIIIKSRTNQPHLKEKILLLQYEGAAGFSSCHYKHKGKRDLKFSQWEI
jgi:hypothetical protein